MNKSMALLFALLLALGTACGKSEQKIYSTVAEMQSEYEKNGFLWIGSLGSLPGQSVDAGWPAKVQNVKKSRDRIDFTVNGIKHEYPNLDGYRLEVVILKDNDGREYAIVFRSVDKI